jgi:DNA-binding CsgD family transcriptional regulator
MPHLNTRQRDVLFLLQKGLRNAEIGRQLGLKERTIKMYVNQLFLIFDASNRTELVGMLNSREALGDLLTSATLQPRSNDRRFAQAGSHLQ